LGEQLLEHSDHSRSFFFSADGGTFWRRNTKLPLSYLFNRISLYQKAETCKFSAEIHLV